MLLGTAIGDALGLPWEGMAARRLPSALPGAPLRGATSDDTEQTVLVAEALLESHDLDSFLGAFGDGLRRWMLGLPLGLGFGTLKAGLWLLAGASPRRSGVRSAGNGAAMRVALLGLVLPERDLVSWVDALSQVTHNDQRAIDGARVVAMAARIGRDAGHVGKRAQADKLLSVVESDEMRAALQTAIDAALRGDSPEALAERLEIRDFVTGYAPHTVPVAVFLWLRLDDVDLAMTAAIRLGGDTDSVAAIVGALCGATGGASSLPDAQVLALRDDIIGASRLRQLAGALSRPRGEPPALRIRWGQWLYRSVSLAPRLLGWILVRRLLLAWFVHLDSRGV